MKTSKFLVGLVAILTLAFTSCQKEEPLQPQEETQTTNNVNNGTTSNGGNNGTGTVYRYIWVFLASDRAYDNLDSLSYDDGTGNIIMLNSVDAKALFTEQGGSNEYRYVNIPISGQEDYEVEVCLYFTPYDPPFSQYYHYMLDVTVGANVKDGLGTCCPENTNNTQCYTLPL